MVRSIPTSCQYAFLAYHYYCDRYDWLAWAGLGVMASSIGPAVKSTLAHLCFFFGT